MYSTFYNTLFWGFILVIIDIRIGGFSILPDFIGFILIYNALVTLARQHEAYDKAKPFALFLIFLSLPHIYETPGQNLLANPLTGQSLPMLLWDQIYLLLLLILLYYIYRAVSGLAKERGQEDLANYSISVWQFYLVLTGILLASTPFMLTLLIDKAGFYLIIIILQFVSFVFFIHLIHRARLELSLQE
ncbi:MAG: hypothetical protein D5R97_06710 [Candidatus Syntrophonatronum acetioxidans]|uniref:Uncharacterized protein n=1 Tax=Candidatus Syntrophonatronum acetioxidans TaxID=1795816 RepID=A0A424YCR6_9FIRM|nr:MAG: hypothetical protein D5R97_06710 [Candidatus Syntrophonatronum acetioxidans]